MARENVSINPAAIPRIDADAIHREVAEALETIRKIPVRVIDSWLLEFGYLSEPIPTREDAICAVAMERGTRWVRELDAHGKRLADRAQFDARRMTGRAGVIR